MDVGEIVDRDSLKRWLDMQILLLGEAQGRRLAVLIAQRAAMRVLPLLWEWCLGETARSRKLNVVAVTWPLLMSTIEGARTTLPSRSAAYASAYSYSDAAASRIADAVAGVADAADAGRVGYLTTRAAYASERASDVVHMWEQIREDCAALARKKNRRSTALWNEHDRVSRFWSEVRIDVLEQGPDWQLWVDWYDKALRGEAQDWDLLTKIALLPAEEWTKYGDDWIKNADHINALIAQIVKDHATASEQEAVEPGSLSDQQRHLADEAARLQQVNEDLLEQLRMIRLRLSNGPPDGLVDDEPPPDKLAEDNLAVISAVEHKLAEVGEDLGAVSEALKDTVSKPKTLAAIGQRLLSAGQSIVGYCGGIADVALQEVAREAGKAFGKTGGKLAAAGIFLSVYGYGGKLIEAAEKLIELAQRLGG